VHPGIGVDKRNGYARVSGVQIDLGGAGARPTVAEGAHPEKPLGSHPTSAEKR
jgi:hypothetical protein